MTTWMSTSSENWTQNNGLFFQVEKLRDLFKDALEDSLIDGGDEELEGADSVEVSRPRHVLCSCFV